jgi:hypothetical protein
MPKGAWDFRFAFGGNRVEDSAEREGQAWLFAV